MLIHLPHFTSASPVAMFKGERYQAVLLNYIDAPAPFRLELLLVISPLGSRRDCLAISLERTAPDKTLVVVVYDPSGRRPLPHAPVHDCKPESFVPTALFIVESMLKDKLKFHVPGGEQSEIQEKLFREFYPDPKLRRKVHYTFAHNFIPAYVKSDPARFFGYFQRGEFMPNNFICSRWQLMEQWAKLYEQDPGKPLLIRRVLDLSMTVDLGFKLPLALIQMPPPEFAAHAYFVAILYLPRPPSKLADDCRIITLERQIEGGPNGVICEWLVENWKPAHKNFERFIPATREDFVSALVSIL